MKRSILIIALIFAVAQYTNAQAPDSFAHPGVLSSQAELDALKEAVQTSNGHPQVAGYARMADETLGNLDYTPTPYANVHVIASGVGDEERAFRQDAHALYIHAIKWVVTGDDAHRDKAIEIADAWGNTFESLIPEENKPNQPTLEASWALPIWIAGAEILKYYDNEVSGWSSASFETFVQKVLVYVNGPIYQTANWLISKDLSLMSAGVFLNDAALYNEGYNHVTGQIDDISTTGQIPELTRDFVHSQYVLIGLAQCAEVAYQQGDEGLFTHSDARLRTGAETYTLSVLGQTSPSYHSSSEWARHGAPYEILLKRYTELELPVPVVQYYVIAQNRPEDGSEDHFVGWLSATHAIEAEAGEAPVSEGQEEVPGNMAFNQTASASEVPQPENPPAAAIDNNTLTRWSAQIYPQWLEVDLGEVKAVGKTEVIFYEDRAYKYFIEVKKSEADAYTQVVDRTANTTPGSVEAPVTDEFSPTQARYVRITVTGASGYTGAWVSLTEFRIFEGDEVILGIGDKGRFNVFPNPASDTFTVEEAHEQVVVLYSLSGAELMKKLAGVTKHFDVSGLPAGLYFVKIISPDQKVIETRKLIKKH